MNGGICTCLKKYNYKLTPTIVSRKVGLATLVIYIYTIRDKKIQLCSPPSPHHEQQQEKNKKKYDYNWCKT